MNRPNPPSPWLAVWLGLAFILRLAWVLHLPATDAYLTSLPDQREYLDLGRNLLHGNGLVFHDPRFDADIYAYRTPGYPVLVALCGGSIRVVRLAQTIIDTSTVLAIYILGRRWLSPSRSLFAAALVALNPLLIYFSGLLLAETLFTALLAWGMALLESPAGLILLACSVVVRPSGLLLPLFLAGLNTANPRAYHLRRAIIAGAIVLALLLPWALRNRARLGSLVWTTTNGGITLYDGFNPNADGSSNQAFVKQMSELKTMGEVERSHYLSHLAMEYIEQHPLRAAELGVYKILRTWSPLPLSREYGHSLKYVLPGLLYTLPLFVLTLIGLLSDGLPGMAKVLLLLPAIYITIIYAVSVGSIRYRVPADVPMAVVAASGLPCRKRSL